MTIKKKYIITRKILPGHNLLVSLYAYDSGKIEGNTEAKLVGGVI